jgi:hypothetical protein
MRRRGRRELLRQALFAVAAAAAPLPAASRGQDSTLATVAALFTSIAEVRRVGAAYRRQYDDEPHIRELHRHLFESLDALDPADLAGWIADRREEDLASGDTVVVSGWLLARSEARLCAAVAVAAAR